MRRATIAALLIALALALAACGSSQTSTTSTTSTTSAAQTPHAQPAAACDGLRMSYQRTEGATGHLEVTFSVRNASTRPCVLRGYPAARLLGAGGRPLPLRLQRGHGFFPDTQRSPRRVALAPGDAAHFALSFVTNNEFAGAHTCRTARSVRASIGGATRTISLRSAPKIAPCGNQLVASPVSA